VWWIGLELRDGGDRAEEIGLRISTQALELGACQDALELLDIVVSPDLLRTAARSAATRSPTSRRTGTSSPRSRILRPPSPPGPTTSTPSSRLVGGTVVANAGVTVTQTP